MSYKWIKKFFGGLSFTAAMFVFQACYGMPQDRGLDYKIEGQVLSKSSGLPVKNIMVSVIGADQYEFTDDSGKFSIYTPVADEYKLSFEDIDSTLNGSYLSADTIIQNIDNHAYINISLKESK